jgi:hypothetical protein
MDNILSEGLYTNSKLGIPGDDVIVHPGVSNDEAKDLFPEFRIVKPYLRFTPLPKSKTTAA